MNGGQRGPAGPLLAPGAAQGLGPPPDRTGGQKGVEGVLARYLLLLLRVSLPLLTGPAAGPGWPGWLRVMRPLGGCGGALGGCAGPPELSPFPLGLSGAVGRAAGGR